MHFFGAIGLMLFFIGFGFFFYIAVDKLFFDRLATKIADRTEFYLALVAMLLGVQFFLTGFIAELVGRNSSSRNVYLVEKTIA